MGRSIIVTTPKNRMAEAAAEAAAVRAAGRGYYFRDMSRIPTELEVGDRVYYVEAWHVRGFAVVCRIDYDAANRACEVTGREYANGKIWMDATSWQWVRPFWAPFCQGFRYVDFDESRLEIVGGWLDPRPPDPEAAMPGPLILPKDRNPLAAG